MNPAPTLKATGLRYRYPPAGAAGSPGFPGPALDGVTVRFERGVTALVGPNGAGKTTLLRCLATTAAPESGLVEWGGRPVNGPDAATWADCRDYRRRLGYVPQRAQAYPEMTPAHFLNYIAALKLVPVRSRADRVASVLSMTGLEPVADRPTGRLSAGQVRRLMLAQALLNRPEVLLIDETGAALDPEEQVVFKSHLALLAPDLTIVLCTHLAAEVEALASRIILLDDGRAAEDLSAADFLTAGQGGTRLPFERAYLVRLTGARQGPLA